MTGLLKKDLYVTAQYSRLVVVLALIFSVIPPLGTLGNTYCILLPLLIPCYAASADEQCGWDSYASVLPCRVEQVVLCKYILTYAYSLLAVLLMLAGHAVRMALPLDAGGWVDTLAVIWMLIIIMVSVTSFGLPLLYRLGAEKGRLAVCLLLGAGVGFSLAMLKDIFSYGTPRRSLLLPLMAVAAAILLAYPSFRLSVRFYCRRRDGAYD